MDISWADAEIPSGHQMVGYLLVFLNNSDDNVLQSFKEAIAIVSTGIFYKVVIPKKLMGVSKEIARIRRGFDELEVMRNYVLYSRLTGNSSEIYAGNDRRTRPKQQQGLVH